MAFIEFLKQIDREVPLSQHIHIILDNYATHKHPALKRAGWHIIRAFYADAWMDLLERFFRDLSQQAILPGSFGSVRQLVDAIMRYLAQP